MSADVVLNLIPRSTGVEITQERGHIFILTDLLLICERMTPQELARSGPDGADMWLLYPPLAGKHLRVAPLNGSGSSQLICVVENTQLNMVLDTALAVTILRKETITMYCETPALRDKLVSEFLECVDRAALRAFLFFGLICSSQLTKYFSTTREEPSTSTSCAAASSQLQSTHIAH